MISFCRYCNCGRKGLWKIKGSKLIHLCNVCRLEFDRYDIAPGNKKAAMAFAKHHNEDAYPFDNRLQAAMRVIL